MTTLTPQEKNKAIYNLVLKSYKAATQDAIRAEAELSSCLTSERLEKEFEDRKGYGLGNKFATTPQSESLKKTVVQRRDVMEQWEQILNHVVETFIDSESKERTDINGTNSASHD